MNFPQKTFFSKRMKKKALYTNTSSLELQILNKKCRDMTSKLLQAEQEIASQALLIMEYQELFKAIDSDLVSITDGLPAGILKQVKRIRHKIKIITEQDDSKNFKTFYKLVHPQFFTRLSINFPCLSTNELKHCAFIKINLSNKEIAQLLNIETKSVNMAHYRLRKKLNVSSNVKLLDVLKNF